MRLGLNVRSWGDDGSVKGGDSGNSVAIISVIVSGLVPFVAAFVALRVHSQRLGHERQLADRAELRRILDAGAELLSAAVQGSADRLSGGHILEPEGATQQRRMVDYGARLNLWVPATDQLLTLWEEAQKAYSDAIWTRDAELEADAWGRLADAAQEWFRVARNRAGISV